MGLIRRRNFFLVIDFMKENKGVWRRYDREGERRVSRSKWRRRIEEGGKLGE